VRDHKSKLHVFLNTCRHRGMKVCRYDEGTRGCSRVPFTAGATNHDGRSVGVPHFKAAYREELDKSAFGLTRGGAVVQLTTALSGPRGSKAPSFPEYAGTYAEGVRGVRELGRRRCRCGVVPAGDALAVTCNLEVSAFSFDGDTLHGLPRTAPSTWLLLVHRGNARMATVIPCAPLSPETRYEMSSRELGHGGHNSIYELPGVAE